MGRRDIDKQPPDCPGALGYHCPVCKYEITVGGNDARLLWSEYNGFLRCGVCRKDYPLALCLTNIDRAIEIFLDSVEAAFSHRTRLGGLARARLPADQLSRSGKKAADARWASRGAKK